MAANPRSDIWALRENTTLSEHAKIAYVMLWSRGDDIRPSMRTLAANMSTSVRTARNAIRELEEAGLLKTAHRQSRAGDNDTNQYELLSVLGAAPPASPPAPSAEPGAARGADKDRTIKDESEGRKTLASRRARPAVTRADVIHFVRRAITISYSAAEAEETNDSQCVALWCSLIASRKTTAPVADPVAYLCRPMADAPYLDTLLANAGDEDDWT